MITHDGKTQHSNRDMIVVFLVAVVGRLPSLGAWWHGGDWKLLARAAGVIPHAGPSAHWLARDGLWSLMWPLAGLEPDPWTWVRLLSHGCVAVLTMRLAQRLRYGAWSRLLAGLLVAVSPLAFHSLLSAQGVETLLAAALGLLAIERGLAGGGAATAVAAIAAAGAILAGNAPLGLPLLVFWWGGAQARRGRDARLAFSGGAVLSFLSAGAIVLIVRQLAPPQGWTAEIAPLGVMLTNLARVPLWMLTPLPSFPEPAHPIVALAGLSVWFLWTVQARRSARDGDRRPGILLICALIAIAPSLPWRTLGTPAACYLAWVPAALMLASVLGSGTIRGPRNFTVAVAAIIACVFAWGGTSFGLKQRRDDGRPADAVVRATAISYSAAQDLLGLPESVHQVVVFQPDRNTHTPLRLALDPPFGTRMILPRGPSVRWSDRLDDLSPRDHVLLDSGMRLKSWGGPTQARLLLVITRIGQGRQDEAAVLLYHTLAGSQPKVPFVFAEDLLPVDAGRVRKNVPDFFTAIDRFAATARDSIGLRNATKFHDTAADFLQRAGLIPERSDETRADDGP